MYEVILFYKYIKIEDPQSFCDLQKKLCFDLGLKGRILIAEEGINGTLEGTSDAIERYCTDLLSQEIFKDVKIKRSQGDGKSFPKLSVKVRKEIVASDLDPKFAEVSKYTADYVTAEELHSWFEEGKEFYVVDMRNDYEQRSGHFENSILSEIEHFRNLPEFLPKIKHLQDQTLVTVCTGGVRCEKASAFLKTNGFKKVYQLKDGIVTYMEKYPNQHFKGKLYVFDSRILLGFNTEAPEHEIIGVCEKCEQKSENYINCAYDECHRHFIVCENCLVNGKAYCSSNCEEIEKNLISVRV
jgi:UPF0176 protein